MTPKRLIVLHVHTYAVLARAIEEGITFGWQHAHKHTATPTPESIQSHIYDDVMVAISEVVHFPDNV